MVPLVRVCWLGQGLLQAKDAVVWDGFAYDCQQDIVIDVVKAAKNIALDEPVDAFPGPVDFGKRRVTPPSWSKSMTVNREAWFVKRLKHGANDLLYQLVCPGRDAERAHLSVLLRNFYPSDRCPSKSLSVHLLDDSFDFHP